MSITKTFGLRFGSGSPTLYVGLGPTFVRWIGLPEGETLASPFVFTLATNPGIYYFTAALSTFAISFVCDGGAGLSSSERYIDGIIDPIATVGDRVGYETSSYGSTSADPSTLFGYVRRAQEVSEGDATFDKSSGVWNVFARGGTLLLFQRDFTNAGSLVTKS